MDLKTFLADAEQRARDIIPKAEAIFGTLPQDVRDHVTSLADDLKSKAEEAVTEEAPKLAGPVFGPEIAAVFKAALDDYEAKVGGEISAAKAQVAGAVQ